MEKSAWLIKDNRKAENKSPNRTNSEKQCARRIVIIIKIERN